MAEEKLAHKNDSGEIRYRLFPDAVRDVLATWDDDGSGSISCEELMVAAKAQEKMNQENRLVKRMLFGAVVVRGQNFQKDASRDSCHHDPNTVATSSRITNLRRTTIL